MGKTIEVFLSDAQHAALLAEAAASGLPFFGYCRSKLMGEIPPEAYGIGPAMHEMPRHRAENDRKRTELIEAEASRPLLPPAAPAADDRIARIEDAVARLTDYVMGQAAPAQPQHPTEPPSVDDIVNAQFADAEAHGLTEHVPDVDEEVMQHAGVRPLSRRPIPFSANSAPRHLQQLLG